ncbi:MAG: hypothetical protein WBX25_34980 [Rhodomicrobium sp.]
MSRRHRHGRQPPSRRSVHKAANTAAKIGSHPLLSASAVVAGLLLFWLVSTTSLPYAVAGIAPDFALGLNPGNPEALIVKTRAVSNKLVALKSAGSQTLRTGPAESTRNKQNTLAQLPEVHAASAKRELAAETKALRLQVHDFAMLAIANDPLDAAAFRMLGEAVEESDHIRVLMQQALGRSRRETLAALWLLKDSYERRDFEGVLNYANILLSTRPDLNRAALSYLLRAANYPSGRDLLITALAAAPSWREQFFEMAGHSPSSLNATLSLVAALRETDKPVSQKEITSYLNFLVGINRTDLAYNAWLQLLPESKLGNLGFLANANFETKPSGVPFDWQIDTGVNAIAEFVPMPEEGASHALHIRFFDGRVKFPEVTQTVLLAPGHYRLEGKLRGTIVGKRGLRWQIHCASGARSSIAETDMLLGESQQWRIFSLEAEVPSLDECRGQTLRLFHDSRSASEELLSGEVWFTGLSLERSSSRLPDQASQAIIEPATIQPASDSN